MSLRRVALLRRRLRDLYPFYGSSRQYSESASSQNPSSASSSLTQLSHRRLVRVRGQDGQKLLQGLVTMDMPELQPGKSSYSMLLNAQGRVLYDIIIYCRDAQDYAMECDSSVMSGVLKHLKMYALRSKVTVAEDSDASVWAAYPGQPEDLVKDDVEVHPDPRVNSFGSRVITSSSASASEVSPSLNVESAEHYKRHRMLCGIAEGPDEMPVGACFPLEYNLDFCHGVRFDKGCYLGQELTARTHHTGVVRKRVMPVEWQPHLSDVKVPQGSKVVNSSGKNVGKIITHVGNVGLALLRVQEVSEIPLTLESEHAVLEIRASVPSWWPDSY